MRADAGAGAHDVGDAGRNQRLRLHGAAYLKQLEKKIHKLKTFKIKIQKKDKKKQDETAPFWLNLSSVWVQWNCNWKWIWNRWRRAADRCTQHVTKPRDRWRHTAQQTRKKRIQGVGGARGGGRRQEGRSHSLIQFAFRLAANRIAPVRPHFLVFFTRRR